MYIIFTTSKHNEREYFLFFLILTVEYEWLSLEVTNSCQKKFSDF